MKEIEAVIFDMDGVIFDTESVWQEAFVVAKEKYALDLDEAYRRTTCGKTEPVIRSELKKMFPNADVDGYRDFMGRYVQDVILQGKFQIKAHFLSTVEKLKRMGYKLALATSSAKRRAERLFEKKGMKIGEIFFGAVFAEDVGEKSKPDPFIFLKASEKIGVKPENCVVVEDSLNGIRAAVNGGFTAVMIEDLIPPDEFCKQNAVLLDDLSFLSDFLEGNKQ